MDVADQFRPRSGACFRCFHLRLSGETSQLGLHAPAGAFPPNPVRIFLRFRYIRPFSRKVGIPHSRDRWPCATGLASYPSSCLPSHPDDTLFGASRSIRILLHLRSHRRAFFPAPSARGAQSATVHLLFPRPVATPNGCSGDFWIRPEPPEDGPPHWLTVATIGSRRLCSPQVPKPRYLGCDSVHGWFLRPAPLFRRVAGRFRLPPGFLVA
jgi:hypothetical protein